MKKIEILIIIAILLFAVALGYAIGGYLKAARAEPISYYHNEWQRIEDSAAEDGANFAAVINLSSNGGVYSAKTSEAFPIYPRLGEYGARYSPGSRWQFAFFGTDAANETFSFNLVGWGQANGMAQVICVGDGVLGTQDVVTEPNGDSITNGLWADTINLDDQTRWPRYDGALGDPGLSVHNSGNNEVAILSVDLAGIEWIDFVTYDVAGTAEASTLGVYGRRY